MSRRLSWNGVACGFILHHGTCVKRGAVSRSHHFFYRRTSIQQDALFPCSREFGSVLKTLCRLRRWMISTEPIFNAVALLLAYNTSRIRLRSRAALTCDFLQHHTKSTMV